MKHNKKDLIKSIARMQSVYDDPDTSQTTREALSGPLEKAKKLLASMEEKQQVQPAGTPPDKPEKKPGRKRKKSITTSERKTLEQIVASAKKYAGYKGTSSKSLKRDAMRKALPPGKRTSSTGNTYTETRTNRSDVNRTAPYLQRGGKVNEEIDEPDFQNDSFITDSPRTGYEVVYAGKFIGVEQDYDNAISLLNQKEEEGKYYPNRWFINERGDYDLIDREGDHVKMEKGGMITAKYVRTDGYNRKIYKGENGHLYVSVEGKPHTLTSAGEPNYPVHNVRFLELSDTNQVRFYAYTTQNFTPAATKSVLAAIAELAKEPNKQSDYYDTAIMSLRYLMEDVDRVLSSDNSQEVHKILQRIGINNYKTGMLVNTDFLDKELATRKLMKGGTVKKGQSKPTFLKEKGGHIVSMQKALTYVEPIYGKVINELIARGYLKKNALYNQWSSGGNFQHFAIQRPDKRWLEMATMSEYGIALTTKKYNTAEQVYKGSWDEGENFFHEYVQVDNETYTEQRPIESIVSDIMKGKWKKLSYASGGTIKRNISRDRKFKSQQPHEQKYKRKKSPKNPVYKKHTADSSVMKEAKKIVGSLKKKQKP